MRLRRPSAIRIGADDADTNPLLATFVYIHVRLLQRFTDCRGAARAPAEVPSFLSSSMSVARSVFESPLAAKSIAALWPANVLAACSLPAAVNRTMRARLSRGWASRVTRPRDVSHDRGTLAPTTTRCFDSTVGSPTCYEFATHTSTSEASAYRLFAVAAPAAYWHRGLQMCQDTATRPFQASGWPGLCTSRLSPCLQYSARVENSQH